MIHEKANWLFVWASKYNDLLDRRNEANRAYNSKSKEYHEANTKIGKLEYSLRSERALNDTLAEERDLAVKEQKSLKKKLSDNAVQTRDVKSGRYKKRVA